MLHESSLPSNSPGGTKNCCNWKDTESRVWEYKRGTAMSQGQSSHECRNGMFAVCSPALQNLLRENSTTSLASQTVWSECGRLGTTPRWLISPREKKSTLCPTKALKMGSCKASPQWNTARWQKKKKKNTTAVGKRDIFGENVLMRNAEAKDSRWTGGRGLWMEL